MFELVVIFLIFLFSFYLSYKNFKLGIYLGMLLSVLVHKELFSFYTWDLMPIRAFMVGVLCTGLTKLYLLIFREKRFREVFENIKDPVILTIFLIWIVRGASIMFSKNLRASFLLYAFFTTITAFFIQAYVFLKNKPSLIIKYLRFYIYLVFGLSLFGYFQWFLYQKTGNIIGALWNIPGNIPRIGSTFWDVNHYGSLLAVLLTILGILFILDKGKKRLLDLIMFVSMSGALLLTNSRTSWIIAFVSFVSFITILLVRKIGAKGIGIVLGALLLISIPFIREYSIKSSPFRARIKQYFHYRLDSFASHIMLLTGTLQIFEEYPILGGGYGSFFEHFSKTQIAPTYFGRDPAALNTRVPAHTIWGEILAETGALGLCVFIPFVAVITLPLLYLGLRSRNKSKYLPAAGMFSAVLGWLIGGIFYSYNTEFFWIVLVFFGTWGISNLKDINISGIFKFFFKRRKSMLLFVAFISAFLIFINLGKNYLIPWDEAIYAQIAKNMIQKNEYINLYWEPDVIWYEKPPFYMWLMVPFMKILGFNSWAARLPGALIGFSLVIFVFVMGKKLFNKTTGYISALALVTTVHYLYYSRASMLDITTTAFITFSLFSYYFAKHNNKTKLWILSGIFTGLSTLTKGVIGLLPLPVMFLYETYLFLTKEQKISIKLIKKYFILVISALVIFLPWHIVMYLRNGPAFIQEYLGYHVWDRATTAVEEKGKPFFWYIEVLSVSMRIWFVGLLISIPHAVYKVIKKDKKYVFLTIWALFTFLFFSAAKSKVVWYIIPIYPALVLIIGSFGERLLNWIMKKIQGLNSFDFKTFALYSVTVFSLFYLHLNKELVYIPNLTKDRVNLLKLKDSDLGTESMLYVDRVELPLVLFYLQSPFEIIDFHPHKINRVPLIHYQKELILLTKLGRFSTEVVGYDYEPTVIRESGDYILWYFESQYQNDLAKLEKLKEAPQSTAKEIRELQETIDYRLAHPL